MNVSSIHLSEFATVGSNNRLTVVNIFDRMMGPGPQWGMPIVYLSWIILAHQEEVGTHAVEIKLVNVARESLLPKPLTFNIELNATQAAPGMPLRHQGIYTLGGLVFGAPGPYAFEMYIDDYYAASTSLHILKMDTEASG